MSNFVPYRNKLDHGRRQPSEPKAHTVEVISSLYPKELKLLFRHYLTLWYGLGLGGAKAEDIKMMSNVVQKADLRWLIQTADWLAYGSYLFGASAVNKYGLEYLLEPEPDLSLKLKAIYNQDFDCVAEILKAVTTEIYVHVSKNNL